MSVIVYTQPSCSQCEQTKRFLNLKEVPYETVDITENQEAFNMIVELGYKSVPVVIAGDKHWSGFRLEQLNQLVSELHSA